ncbi:leucine-rich repeat protein 1 isoform X2 [Nerophis ophidion]|uniref:leucine-rich repeat protein 1 isoform X2 n=1 Tax=Nerophis ophidion TaxID=159077 RepID=UPI002ADF577B|nr:leucine-rich repeat protein 1 isoform X2 [Nerophis ophidion]
MGSGWRLAWQLPPSVCECVCEWVNVEVVSKRFEYLQGRKALYKYNPFIYLSSRRDNNIEVEQSVYSLYSIIYLLSSENNKCHANQFPKERHHALLQNIILKFMILLNQQQLPSASSSNAVPDHDTTITMADSLRKLDLSNNHIKKLPATIGDLGCLSELVLHNNHLEAFSEALCLSTLQRTLQLLDLSQNRLRFLPAQFCQLRELVNLKLDDNKLVGLPFHVGRLTKLRFLSVAHNQLVVLPGDFRKLRLENLDLFGNPFIQPNPLDNTMQLTFPVPLQELASRAVADLRIPYGPHLIPAHLCRDLDVAKTCDCGHFCVSFYIKTAVSMNLHQVSHTVVLVDDMGGTDAPVTQHYCSLSCYSQFLDKALQRGIR